MSRVWAFLQRDWRLHSSYRMGFFVSLGHALFSLAAFFFISRLIDPHGVPALAPYGGAYFPFVLLGLAVAQYLTTSLSGFAGSIREEQLQGTLEAILASPTRLGTLLLGSVAWPFCWTTLEVAVYLGLGTALFGVDLAQANIAATMLLLGLTILSFSSLGVLAVSGVLLFQESDPVSWLLGGLMKLLGGVYFPLALLPGWLEWPAKAFPLTYALEGLRQAVLSGRSISQLWDLCVALGMFALIGWPVAVCAVWWTIRRLKVAGALSFR